MSAITALENETELYSLEFLSHFLSSVWERPRVLREQWERAFKRAVDTRSVDVLHKSRDRYESWLAGNIRVLADYQRLVETHEAATGNRPRYACDLSDALNATQEFYAELFPRWQTLDDLQQIIRERLSPSQERSRYLAKKYPPPRSWYEETVDPFAPDEATESEREEGMSQIEIERETKR